jgi:hypothetical protein
MLKVSRERAAGLNSRCHITSEVKNSLKAIQFESKICLTYGQGLR